ncbi:MAG: hypothetical protein ACRDQ7_03185 [Haloechinothrix sp.]
MRRDRPVARAPSRPGKVVVVALLVVLVAVPATAWAAWGSGDEPIRERPTATLPDPEPRRPARVDPLIDIPGRVVLNAEGPPEAFSTVGALEELDADILASHDAAHVTVVVTARDGLRRGIWRFSVQDGAAPTPLKDSLDATHQSQGWVAGNSPSADVTVLMTPSVIEHIPGQTPTIRAHYVRGRDVIRVDTYSTGNDDVVGPFNQLLSEQLAAFPARGDRP